MAFFFSTPLHQLCKYSSPFSHYNFHSLSTQKHPLQLGFYPLLAKTQVSDIETRNPTTNNKTIDKSLSGYCLSDDDNKRAAENFGKNGRERDIGHFDTKNSTTNNRTVEKSLSGFCLSDNDNKRVVENFGKNGVKNGREREIGSKKNTSNTTYDRPNVKFTSGGCSSVDENKRVVKNNEENGSKNGREIGSKNGSKGEIFMKKLNNEVRGNGVGLVVGENVDRSSKQKIRVSPRSSKNENFVKNLVSVIEKNGSGKGREFGSGKSPRSSKGGVFVKKWNEEVAENGAGLVVERSLEKGSRKRSGIEFGVSPRGPKGENFMKKSKNVDVKKQKGVNKEKNGKTDKNKVTESPGLMERADLDMCSKRGDVMGALNLYDKAQIEGVIVGQYHYSVLLYLCSSAAIGVVSPAKSGKDSRSLSNSEASSLNSIGPNENTEICNDDFANKELNSHISKNRKPKVLDRVGEVNNEVINGTIRLSDDFRKYALKRGFEIYEKMCSEKVAMNEASLTSIARMALAMGDGDMAFDTIKQMKELGINPRLRSYGPALTAFCNSGNIDKAFLVEKHMLEHGVYPEEPEYEALLRVSIEENRSDKVYYLLHRLRSSVRQVSESTADLIETWFNCEEALKVERMKWDENDIRKAIQRGGGGWHGEGWLGKGKWNVVRTNVGVDGFCKCCGGKLATIDLDPVETEKFAESVESIATKREKSSFQKFQKWLDYYGPFEAVVDAANIGLYSQRKFKPSKVNAVVNGIRQMLPSKKWPLIVLHNRRVTDENMDKPMNKAIVEKWKNADALYATPTGSNDDWYWLYAAIKYKCLLVTNDEMRDHLFQLLGNDFFPRWKERHQVRFNFSETGPLFHMPPPCSVVIQESEKGHWHIPMVSEYEFTEERKWLCVTRHGTVEKQKSATMHGDINGNAPIKSVPQEDSDGKISSTTVVSSKCSTILRDLEAAEKLGECVVSFEI